MERDTCVHRLDLDELATGARRVYALLRGVEALIARKGYFADATNDGGGAAREIIAEASASVFVMKNAIESAIALQHEAERQAHAQAPKHVAEVVR